MSSTNTSKYQYLFMTFVLIVLVIIRIQNMPGADPDTFNPGYNYTRFLENLGYDANVYVQELSQQEGVDEAERQLIIGRIQNNPKIICKAYELFDEKKPKTNLEKALVLETMAGLFCGNRKKELFEAAKIWRAEEVYWRAELLESLAKNTTPKMRFEASTIVPDMEKLKDDAKNASVMVIGKDKLSISSSDKVISQADKTYRDWLSYQIYDPFTYQEGRSLLRSFSERRYYDEMELREDIGWHEGERNELVREFAGSTYVAGIGTLAARKNGTWYASDEQGVFRYEIPEDEIMYPTTRFLGPNISMIIDTHGMNMLVEPALREQATVVYADCDHPGTLKAALDLEQKGVHVVCTVGRFLYLLLGHGTHIMGNPPIKKSLHGAELGNRPIWVFRGEKIIIMNSTQFYYDTPTKYFTIITQAFPLDAKYVLVRGDGGMKKLISLARVQDVNILAVRIYNSQDYYPLKAWLEEDVKHRAILFNTYAHPYGKLLMDEFPFQTSYQDPSPIFR